MKLKSFIWLFAMLIYATAINAQDCKVSGVVIDKESSLAIERATIQLLNTDSSYVVGALTTADGNFMITTKSSGQYLLKISCLGYKELIVPLKLSSDKPITMGTLGMENLITTLDETIVTANVPKVVVKEDTLVYNAAAYRVAEGSSVEALIERLPGAQINDDGTITLNGKQVTKFLMDGREFLIGDIETTLKNLPADMIENIKSYDKKSDLSKVTGIDDGNDETVLDFGIKKSMKRGFNINSNVGIGTKGRYNGRIMGARFQGNTKVTVLGNANNTNNRGSGEGRGRSNGKRGLQSSKTVGVNLNYDKRDVLRIDGGISWNHSDSDNDSKVATESFVNKSGAYSNSKTQSYGRNEKWTANMNLRWTPDTMTTITFRPTVNVSANDRRSFGASASFSEDPYELVDDPLASSSIDQMAANNAVVNSRNNKNISYGRDYSVGANFQLHRKLNSKGRNVALNGGFSYSNNDNTGLSATAVHLFKVKDITGQDSIYQTNRYNLTPSHSMSYNVQATYTEPVFKSVYLQTSYTFRHDHSVSDRSTYNFGRLNYASLDDVMNEYRDWNSYLDLLEKPLEDYLSETLSRYAERDNYIHNIDLQLRIVNNKLNMNVGMMVRPQRSYLKQDYRGVFVDTVRNVTNIAPTLNMRYIFSKRSDIRFTYRGSTSQPSIVQMLDITDDSNPMYINKGNPGLRSSFTNNIGLNFKAFLPKHQTTIATNINGRITNNSISNMVTYDDDTGVRTTQPQNINGNWNVDGTVTFNTSIDTAGVWRANSFSRVNYNHYVSFVTLNKTEPQKNTTHTYSYREKLSFGYRKDWLEIELVGDATYNKTRNELQSRSNLDTWRYSYGANLDVELPWGMKFSTDLHQHCRRGYNDSSMNTNELIWNLQISQSFLRRKALTVMLHFFDVLQEQSSFTRVVNANHRSDTEYNAINSYALLRVNYRLNVFGGKKSGGEARKGNQKSKKRGSASIQKG